MPSGGPRVRDLNEDGIATWLDVRTAFGRLSAKERAALITVALLGFTPEEAAEPLGMTAGGVRAAVSRARAKFGSER
jgi:DNA-directed RNA polymerase specialized sigma24 family protein